ncbi:MAG TPA: DUF362 domain-containing protein [bacterium]|nr:DUF362 domain-containing protein [bacterium]
MKTFAVYLGTCSAYDPTGIAGLIRRALEVIPLSRPMTGRIVVKPNLVMAHPKIATESFTRKEVIEGILRTVAEKGAAVECVQLVEKSGLGVTTASMFRWAGYNTLAREYGVRLWAMEENPRVRVVLENGRIHRHVSVARPMAERDFLIFAPKLKTNVLTQGFSGALKLNVGTIDSRERLHHHDRDLPVKIVDLLGAADPDLIVTDGIRFAFGGNQMTQGGTDLGVVIVANDAVAHDMVAARLLNLDPLRIDHIREAVDRGYGPARPEQIRILGDYPVERAQAVTSRLDFGYMPVEKFPCNFRIRSGTPYCTGGCQGIFLDWLHMIRDRKPGVLGRFPRIPVLIGKVTDRVEAKRILLVGDCAAASPDLRAGRIVRIPGCPPTHKRIILSMMLRFFLIAPLVRPSLIWDGFVLYPVKWLKGRLVNLKFRPSRWFPIPDSGE